MANTLAESKNEIFADLERRVRDKILERSNADLLKKLIEKTDNVTEAIAVAELGTTYKRTGLHFDKRLEKWDNTIKYFKKNESLSFTETQKLEKEQSLFKEDSKPLTHKLIIGDNYDALLNLLIQYRGQVDVIYIDPPYGKDSMGEFAQTNYENAITRDNLLSMLYPRLVLAKQLLSDNGVIFCSIDDRNQAYVKCLFDEVFEERNFLAQIVLKSNPGGRDYGGLALTHEYITCYRNGFESELNLVLDSQKKFEYKDSIGEFDTRELRNRNIKFNDKNRPNLCYSFYVNKNNIDENGLYEVSFEKKTDYIEVLPLKSQEIQTVWRWGKEKALENLNINVKAKLKQDGTFKIVEKYRSPYRMERTIWDETSIRNEAGSLILKDIFDAKPFDYPKSVETIKRLVALGTNENSIILDFFAGSGTTGQAVLELNAEDRRGGKEANRTFILCTSNEKTDTTPNGVATDVTSKRLKRVMTGECYDGTNNFKWLKENNPLGDNLDVYEIGTVANFETTVGKTPFDVIDETLYGQEKFEIIQEKIEWVIANFEGTQKMVEADAEWRKRKEE
ncbi:MAG: site-specific DNA-methyltransferase [Prevotellaceae bacterium]|jgi:adenine-specific DNA-methyltransferase|nr:site-specific DNA-methyltransferase [Prevotellaceae bacterium]